MADCCIFAGQGAQVPGMGKDFAEGDVELMALFDKANGVLGFDLKKVCFEGPAEELTKSGFLNTNAHKTIYVVAPENNYNSQLIFRDNLIPEITGKNIMILMAMVSTGKTLNKAMECVQYYGGKLAGVSALFSELEDYEGEPILAVFGKKDLPDYGHWDYRSCPLCQAGKKLDALVNAYGYQML